MIEAAEFFIANPTKPAAFHASSVYIVGKQLQRRLYDRFGEFNDKMKRRFLKFLNEKVVKVSKEGRSWITRLSLNCV